MLAVLSDLSCGVGSRGRSKRECDETVAGVLFPRAGKPLLIDPLNPSLRHSEVVSNLKRSPATIHLATRRRRNVGLLRSIDSRYKRLAMVSFLRSAQFSPFFLEYPRLQLFFAFPFRRNFGAASTRL